MTTARNAFCREAARDEQSAWEEFGPAQVEAGAISQAELDRSIAAWAMLAELFDADGRHPSFDLYELPVETVIARFQRLEEVTGAALARRDSALAAASADNHAREYERRGKVWLIHTRISRSREHWQTCLALTARLRGEPEKVAA